MKIAILGGSFNPIHTGHLALADDVCTSLGYDKVLFVPTFIPPHKQMNSTVSAEERLELVRLACEGDCRFEAEPCEIMRGGTSFTYDTICYLEEKFKDCLEGKIGIIMGRDLFSGFHFWHKAQELAEKCDLILAERPSSSSCKNQFDNKAVGNFASVDHGNDAEFIIQNEPLFKNAVVLKNPVLDISSTEIRKRAAEGLSFRYLVPSQVFQYIVGGNLYGKK